MSFHKKTVAIILASGKSLRFSNDDDLPKQYVNLNGYPILFWSISKMLCCRKIDHIKVVIRKEHLHFYDRVACLFASNKLLAPVFGGDSRQDSSYIGLRSIVDINPDNVIIHDASRPFFSNAIIDKSLEMMNDYEAVVPVIPIMDSLSFVSHDHTIITYISRNSTKILQTPQFYKYSLILEAHDSVRICGTRKDFSDDSSIIFEYGVPITVTEGEYDNFKITTYKDFIRGELCLREMKI